MEKCICKIYKNDGSKGTGFFCKINYDNKEIPVMITNYHVINDEYRINSHVHPFFPAFLAKIHNLHEWL